MLALVWLVLPLAAWCGPTPIATITTLAVRDSNNHPVAQIHQGAAVTLIATVKDIQGNPIPFGTVVFCDGPTAPCRDGHNLGSAQLTTANPTFDTATLTIVPGVGTHSLRALYLGVGVNSTIGAHPASTSTAHILSVLQVATLPTTTTIAKSGSVGNYSLSATVVGTGSGLLNLTGNVNFLDSTNSGFNLGSAPLGPSSFSLGFSPFTFPPIPPTIGILSAVGDFNNDGLPDLLLVVPDFSNPNNYDVAVLLNTGGGNFGPPNYLQGLIPPGAVPTAIAVGDFLNNDKLGFAIATLEPRLYVFQGSGTGLFGATFNMPTFEILTAMVVGDFYNSGNQSIVGLSPDGFFVFQGLGTGNLTPQGGQLFGVAPSAIAAGDFLGNGLLDLAITDAGSNNVTIFIGNGTGGFQQGPNFPVGSSPAAIVAADFNGDGFLDLAVANSDDDTLTILQGAANLNFTVKSTPSTGSMPWYLALGDFNGDGKFDLAVGNAADTSLNILVGKGDGTFTSSNLSFSYPLGLSVADFNADGNTDLLAFSDLATTLFFSQPTATAMATLNGVSPVGAGTHQVGAAYPGDLNYSASNSGTVPLTAQAAATTLQLAALPVSSSFGSQVALTATLAPYSAQNHGTDGELVTFYDGNNSLGTAPLSLGVATLNVNWLSVGPHSLRASYGGDTNFAPSTALLSFNVGKAASTTALTAATNSPNVGTADLLTATVTGFSTPRGNVVFTQNGSTLCTAPLSAGGTATCSYTPWTTSPVQFVATYSGDQNYAGSSSSTLTLTALYGVDSKLTMTFDSTQLTYPGATNTRTCVTHSGNTAPTGTIEILDGNTIRQTLSLGGDGCAYWYINPGLDAGTHHMRAFYSGDRRNHSGYSAITDVIVAPVRVQMVVSCWNSYFTFGNDYHCGVYTSSNAGPPPGNITYSYDGGALQSVSLANGNATFVIPRPRVGNHTVAITYPGTRNFAAAPTNTQYFTVTR
ncbi:MAG: Ig-like domain repeat protein [Terracidiphilus sp.]